MGFFRSDFQLVPLRDFFFNPVCSGKNCRIVLWICELKWVMQAYSDGNQGMKFPVPSAFCCSLVTHCAENKACLAKIGKVNVGHLNSARLEMIAKDMKETVKSP